jgi:hypothetical protein
LSVNNRPDGRKDRNGDDALDPSLIWTFVANARGHEPSSILHSIPLYLIVGKATLV